MKETLVYRCSRCKRETEREVSPGEILCPRCSQPIGRIDTLDAIFDHCPICQCRQFYLSKDLNQTLGCLVVLIGIILVPWTYGLSLPFCALIDWVLYKRLPTIVHCYRCKSLFRGFKPPKILKPFDHHTALQYEYQP